MHAAGAYGSREWERRSSRGARFSWFGVGGGGDTCCNGLGANGSKGERGGSDGVRARGDLGEGDLTW